METNNGKRPESVARNTVDGFVNYRERTVRRYSLDYAMRRPAPVDSRPYARPASLETAIAAPAPTPVAETPVAPTKKRVRIDMSLPGAEPLDPKKTRFKRRVKLVRHRAFQTAMVAMALLIGSGALLFAQGFFNAKKVFKGGAQAAALSSEVDPNALKGEGEGRINILLLGIGGIGHEAPDLSDTMIVASIDPVNKTASLLSVPRDLWVKVPGSKTTGKINAAYEVGKYAYLHKMDSSNNNTQAIKAGFKTADETVEQVLGIDIHYNMLVNFASFKQAVDTVGGVTVNVPEDLYDPTMAWENGGNSVLAKAGVQQFDGKHALIYVRSRETSSDFARSQRQRALILALKEKIVTLGTLSNPLKISKLMNAFGNNVVTDLSLNDASRLYTLTKGIGDSGVKSLGLADGTTRLVTTGRVGNQSVVLPVAGQDNYDAIHMFVRKSLPDGFITKENSRVVILNGTMIDGLATEKADDLKTYGYNVVRVDSAPTAAYQRTVLVDLTHGKDKYTKHYMEQRFGVRATTSLPDNTLQNRGTDFILILGSDETSSR
jgi:LCP family protein required for cell wall assembly